MQLGFLMQELSSYGLLTSLKTAASVRAASDLVLLKFEKPADQSEAAKTRRASYGQAYYDKYAGAAKAPVGGGSMMSVLIGHASIDENGRASGGQAGDQTGKEVCIQTWYSSGWNVILRPKSTDVAEKMASACEILCKSNLVGYDQGQRNTLWDELEKVGWNPSVLKTKCEADCSAFMTACARVAGINVPRVALGGGQYNAPITQTMRSAFGSTGAFDILTDTKYCTSDKYLKRGDIIVRESGHTAMVLGDGELAGGSAAQTTVTPDAAASVTEKVATEPAYSFDKTLAGTYTVTADSGLHIRNGAGTGKASLAVLPKGTKVQNYGYYTLFCGVKWLYIQVTYNGVTYTGFSSSQYLRK